MGVVEQIEELFMDWAKDDCFAKTGELGQFVPDGIVDYEMFETAERKLLFVLRDSHDKDNKYYIYNTYRKWIKKMTRFKGVFSSVFIFLDIFISKALKSVLKWLKTGYNAI